MNTQPISILPQYPNNYLAIALLDDFGIDDPSQAQIDKAELLIANTMRGKPLPARWLSRCMRRDNFAQQLLKCTVIVALISAEGAHQGSVLANADH